MPIIVALLIVAFVFGIASILLTLLINPVLAMVGLVMSPAQMICLILFVTLSRMLWNLFDFKKH